MEEAETRQGKCYETSLTGFVNQHLQEMEIMSNAKFFIPVIFATIISGILIFPAAIFTSDVSGPLIYPFFNYRDTLVGFSENLILARIIIFAPILTAVLLSLISGYSFASVDSSEKYPFGVIFLLAASIPIVVVCSYLFYLPGLFCEGNSCGTGFEPFMGMVDFCLPTAILSPLIGLCTAFFYWLGMKIKYYKGGRVHA